MVAGKYLMQEAMRIDPLEFEMRVQLLQMSQKAFEYADATGAPFAGVVEDQIQLEKAQRQLSHTLVGKSLRKTIFDAVRRQE